MIDNPEKGMLVWRYDMGYWTPLVLIEKAKLQPEPLLPMEPVFHASETMRDKRCIHCLGAFAEGDPCIRNTNPKGRAYGTITAHKWCEESDRAKRGADHWTVGLLRRPTERWATHSLSELHHERDKETEEQKIRHGQSFTAAHFSLTREQSPVQTNRPDAYTRIREAIEAIHKEGYEFSFNIRDGRADGSTTKWSLEASAGKGEAVTWREWGTSLIKEDGYHISGCLETHSGLHGPVTYAEAQELAKQGRARLPTLEEVEGRGTVQEARSYVYEAREGGPARIRAVVDLGKEEVEEPIPETDRCPDTGPATPFPGNRKPRA